jgi:hypothetical protein
MNRSLTVQGRYGAVPLPAILGTDGHGREQESAEFGRRAGLSRGREGLDSCELGPGTAM